MTAAKTRAVALRRGWVVNVAAALAAAAGFGLSVSDEPTWSATAELVVPAAQASSPSEFLGRPTEANRLAATYAVLLPRDRQLLEATATSAGYPVEGLSEDLTVTNIDGTSLVEVVVVSGSEDRAQDILLSFVEAITGSEPASTLVVPSSLETVRVGEPVADAPRSPVAAALVGGILGAALGFIIAVFWERSDPRIDTATDLEDVLGVSTSTRAELIGPEALAIVRKWVAMTGGTGDVVLFAYGSLDGERARLLVEGAEEHSGGVSRFSQRDGCSATELRGSKFSDADALDRAGLIVILVGPETPVSELERDVARLAVLDHPIRWAVFDG